MSERVKAIYAAPSATSVREIRWLAQRALRLEGVLRSIALDTSLSVPLGHTEAEHYGQQLRDIIGQAARAIALQTVPSAESYGEVDADDEGPCSRCLGSGEVVNCIDDMCHGTGECIHEGNQLCPECHGGL